MSEEFDGEENGPKALREAYEKLKKENATALERLAKLEAAERATSVTQALKAKGLSDEKAAKVARFYNADDTSADAVGKWLEGEADTFGLSTAAPQQTQAPEDPNAQAAARVLGATFQEPAQTGQSLNGKPIGNPAEMLQLMKTAPVEELRKLGLLPPA